MNLRAAVVRDVGQYRMIPTGGRILVAVSGGADSLALLHALAALKSEFGCELVAATLDHGLRGAAGAADADFVAQTAAAWGLPCERGAVSVPALAREWRMGLEAAARRARYDFLAAAARRTGADRLALAHQADDQAETVLLHLLRGAGLAGLRGMQPISHRLINGKPMTIIRPLLSVPRSMIDAYCAQHGLQPRRDATNDETRYRRNQLRLQTLPALRAFNPQIDRALITLSEIASTDEDFLARAWRKARQRVVIEQDAARITFDRPALNHLHAALQRRALRWAVQHVMDESSRTLTHERVLAALAHIEQGQAGSWIDLTGGARLRVETAMIILERKDAPEITPDLPLLLTPDPQIIPVPSRLALANGWFLVIGGEAPLGQPNAVLKLPPDAPLIVRGRQSGDRFTTRGMVGTHSLKEWMIDHKVPRTIRSRVPLLLVGNEIALILWGDVWQRGHTSADDDPTSRAVVVRLERAVA